MNESPFQLHQKKWLVFLALALLLGMALRLCFPGDIEYKDDERYMFNATQTIGLTEGWPALGMVSGGQVRNPGMSVWVMVLLSHVLHASTPPELARAVQWLNILGLFVLAFFSLVVLPERERLPWFWATAFAAVSPVAVLFQRKIWAQSTLPLFCVLFWMAWHYRKGRAGAFFWGLLGICLGQIHLAGFYLAAGVFLWTLYRDRRARWGFWLLGSLLGALPLAPWIPYVLSNGGTGFSFMKLFWVIYPKYWIFWVTDSLGFGLIHSMKAPAFLDFLRYPLVAGHGTYLVGALHGTILVYAVRVFVSAAQKRGFREGIADISENGLILNSVLLASGLLMTLSCFKINQHYLIMSFPLEWVWLSRLGLSDPRGSRWLSVLWAAQLLVTLSFLAYLHVNHGVPAGDYGTAYQFQ